MIYHPFRHLGLKAISVALALLIWLAVSGEQTVERSLSVPLELQNIPEKLELVDIPPPTVEARVRGGSGLLSHMSPGDVVAVLDLSDARPGRRYIPLTVDRVHAPVGVEVTQVMPSTIPLEFQRSASRFVHVAANLEGQPAPGYEVESVSAQPATVEVVGPEIVLRQLTRVMTEPISVAGASQTLREAVTLGVSIPGLRLRTPGKAAITVNIRAVLLNRTMSSVPVHARNQPPKTQVRLTPAQVTMHVKGTDAAVSDLTPGRFQAFVDLAGLRPGRYNLKIQVEPPPNVQVVQIQPPSVVVRIR